jgi:hypothetical protein
MIRQLPKPKQKLSMNPIKQSFQKSIKNIKSGEDTKQSYDYILSLAKGGLEEKSLIAKNIISILSAVATNLPKKNNHIINHLTLELTSQIPISVLVQYLQHDNPLVLKFSLSSLIRLSVISKDHHHQIEKLGTIHMLVRLLKHNDNKVRQYAVIILGSLAEHIDDIKDNIAEAQAIDPLVELLTDTNDKIKAYTARALGRLAYMSHDRRKTITDAGAVVKLVALFSHPDPLLLKYVLCAFINLTSNSYVAILNESAMTNLVNLLSNDNDKVVKYAIHAIYALVKLASASQTIKNSILQTNAMAQLRKLASINTQCNSKLAKKALLRLSRPSPNRTVIESALEKHNITKFIFEQNYPRKILKYAEYYCPISFELLLDPVILGTTGMTFDRHFIEEALKNPTNVQPKHKPSH